VQLTAAQNDKVKSFFTGGDVQLITRLKNTGDIYVKPFGKVTIKKMFGGQVGDYEFNKVEPRANVLPDSTRKFTDILPGGVKSFGRYTVTINLGYSQGSGQLITASTSFWYVPKAVLYGLIVVVIVLVGAVYWVVRQLRARRRHTHDVSKQKS
jgi:hypothetical protein